MCNFQCTWSRRERGRWRRDEGTSRNQTQAQQSMLRRFANRDRATAQRGQERQFEQQSISGRPRTDDGRWTTVDGRANALTKRWRRINCSLEKSVRQDSVSRGQASHRGCSRQEIYYQILKRAISKQTTHSPTR